MENYLGEFSVDIAATPYRDYGPKEWALEYIFRYGQIDGDHHKAWVLDQVTRILNDTPVVVKEARWGPNERHHDGLVEYRINTSEPPSPGYLEWVDQYCNDGEYDYDCGRAP